MAAAERRPELIGGPLDGATIAPGTRPVFIFCAESPRTSNGQYRAKAFVKHGADRHLYRYADGNFKYAGHRFRVCDGCGAYVAVVRERCLCGTPQVANQ